MPNLADIAEPFPGQLVAQVGVATMPVPWACHNATLAWLYHAEYGRAVTGLEFGSYFLGAQATMGEMAKEGMALAAPSGGGQIFVPAGTVLIFVRNSGAKHSCVMKANNLIVGYNQQGWLAGKGGDHSFSMHSTKEIRWQGGGNVLGSADQVCSLMAVPETVVRRKVRDVVTRAAAPG
jgi:hypothetical protein